MANLDDVRDIVLELPETEESTSYGTPAFKVRKKLICRLWGEREHKRDNVHDTEVLMVRCELDAKPMLLDAHDDVLFSTPHYKGYCALLIRMADTELDLLADLLEDSYRIAAPATLVRKLDG